MTHIMLKVMILFYNNAGDFKFYQKFKENVSQVDVLTLFVSFVRNLKSVEEVDFGDVWPYYVEYTCDNKNVIKDFYL